MPASKKETDMGGSHGFSRSTISLGDIDASLNTSLRYTIDYTLKIATVRSILCWDNRGSPICV
jgi:hypothetical protein